jgi:hypothetical protein
MAISNLHLIAFGGGSFAYRRSARRLSIQAEASGLFKTVTRITDKSFHRYCALAWHQHQDFMLSAEKGFGYWLWKPIIIQQRLSEIPLGDVLVYIDAGCELNLLIKEPRDRMQEYVKLATQHGSLAMQMIEANERGLLPTEQSYSKAALISAVQPSKVTMAEQQLLAGIIFLKHDSQNKKFVQTWLATSTQDNYFLLTDSQDQIESANFVAHRHDQSIFSLLYKEFGKYYIPDETSWKPNWFTRGANYPIWAMRNRTGVSKGVMKVPDFADRVILRLQSYGRVFKLK